MYRTDGVIRDWKLVTRDCDRAGERLNDRRERGDEAEKVSIYSPSQRYDRNPNPAEPNHGQPRPCKQRPPSKQTKGRSFVMTSRERAAWRTCLFADPHANIRRIAPSPLLKPRAWWWGGGAALPRNRKELSAVAPVSQSW